VAVLENLRSHLGAGAELAYSEFRDNRRIVVGARWVYAALSYLKNELGYDMLFELTCADYLYYPDAKDRFGVVFGLLNTRTGERLLVKTWVNEPDPALQSVVPLWSGANWLEREVYDMYGVRFEGHPDLRRILMPEEFASFPLRKDYPLRGRGERHNFPVLARADG
jgi:NADH (or F420H2) dehydrogenase, subunit C